jgi:3-oxoacyl-[acyl-carrier-protein] synthase II
MTPIHISSVGIVGPGVYGMEDFRRVLYSPSASGSPPATDVEAGVPVLRVDDEEWTHGINKRVLRRLDRFTQLAIYAAEQTVAASAAASQALAVDPFRIGLSIGNNYGGWSYVDPMMKPLYENGMTAINPFVATAWFPAAPQGEISIRLGVKGTSKTFSVERLSAAYAIDFAAFLLEHGVLDVAVAGGAEAPLTPFVLTSMRASHLVTGELPAGEAACMLTLQRTGAADGPWIAGIGKGPSPRTSLSAAAADAALAGTDIDLVLLDPPRGAGSSRDAHLSQQLDALTATCGRTVPVALPLPFGETVGASFAIQIAAACVALGEQRAPVSRLDGAWARALDGRPAGSAGPLANIAVLSSDDYGQWVAAIVTGRNGSDERNGATSHVH